MKISKLEYQKRDTNRVNVYVDDKFIAGIDANDVIGLKIYKGQEISPEELNKIINVGDFGKLFNAALNFLSYRPRSEWEIRYKLKFKTKDDKLIETVIDKLKKIGQVNDQEFAKWYVDQRQTFRPIGKRALQYELAKKGLDKKLIQNQESQSSISDLQLAKKAISKIVNRLRTVDLDKENLQKTKTRLSRYLAGRGFDWDTIKEVVDEIIKKGYNKNETS